jgi:diadenosine tetraphosphate (Ap4A) HIT family hydrolase
MNDSRYPWLVLVPRVDNVAEWFELEPGLRQTLFEEVMLCGETLKALGAYKINTGALGNVVRQLHVHILGRLENDPAWPGPVWGHSPALPYTEAAAQTLRLALAGSLLASRFDFGARDDS